jgi:ABC-type spermidine/putrescine transport system permease subunit II
MSGRLGAGVQALLLAALYLFLYGPILYIVYASLQIDSVWPFPPAFTLEHHGDLWQRRDYHAALRNSVLIGLGSGAIATLFATLAAMAMLKYRSAGSTIVAGLFLAPLFVAHILIGIASLLFSRTILGLSGGIVGATLANSTYATAFALLVVLAQLVRYDWRLDDAAMVFGARPWRTFWTVTLPITWPAILSAFIVSFLLAFNNLEISFYNVGATPTLPTLAWGSLRHGISPELYALAAVINAAVFALLAALYVLLRTGAIRVDFRD